MFTLDIWISHPKRVTGHDPGAHGGHGDAHGNPTTAGSTCAAPQPMPRTCAWNSQRWGPVDLWMQPCLIHDVVTWFETLSHLKVFWLYVVRIWSSIYSWFQPYLGRWSSLATSLSHLSPSDCLHPVNLTWDSKRTIFCSSRIIFRKPVFRLNADFGEI